MRVLISSYAGEMSTFEHDGKDLRPSAPSVRTSAPSFLAVPVQLQMVYAVSEVDDGAVLAFRLADDLRPARQLSTGGSQPCHVAVSPDGPHVVCANYGGGGGAVFATKPDTRTRSPRCALTPIRGCPAAARSSRRCPPPHPRAD